MAQFFESHDLETFAKALGNPDWDVAMDEEYHSLMANDTWDLIPLPKERKLVRCKWVYRTKYASDGIHFCDRSKLGFIVVNPFNLGKTFGN